MKFPSARPRLAQNSQSGVALILALTVVVLVTAIVLAFTSRSRTDLSASSGFLEATLASQFADNAVQSVVAQLHAEIEAGSNVTTVNGVKFFSPKEPANWLVQPSFAGNELANNVVKMSGPDPFYQSQGGWTFVGTGPDFGSTVKTSEAAQNGRTVPFGRWRKPWLMSVAEFDALDGADLNPSWIYVKRSGVTKLTTVSADNKNARAESDDFVVGRYAYIVYDTSGLLDLNVAGYPKGGATWEEEAAGKGSLAWADLGEGAPFPNVRGQSEGIGGWRLPGATVATFQEWLEIQGQTQGFLRTQPQQNRFLSRTDLLHYRAAHPSEILDYESFRFFTHTSRELNAPSVLPRQSSSEVATVPELTRDGRPFPERRFPLAKLDLFENVSANELEIQERFALEKRSDGLWDYVDPDTGERAPGLPTIKSLAEVASLSREPTFWEYLKAAILEESLGNGHGNLLQFRTNQDLSVDRQVLQIGVALIDQWDADSVPTVIEIGDPFVTGGPGGIDVNNLNIEGIENLPGIAWITQAHVRDSVSPPIVPGEQFIRGYFMFGLWNPHRNSQVSESRPARLRANGRTFIDVAAQGLPRRFSLEIVHNDTVISLRPGASTFEQITVLSEGLADTSATSSEGLYPPGAANPIQVGIHCGTISYPSTQPNPNSLRVGFGTPLSIVCEVQDDDGNWIPYQTLPRIEAVFSNDGNNLNQTSAEINAGRFDTVIVRPLSDPRTARFGMPRAGTTQVNRMKGNAWNLIQGGTAVIFSWDGPLNPLRPPLSTQDRYSVANLARNLPSGPERVIDRDDIVRPGDFALTPNFSMSPYGYGEARPILLNRKFRSVAEMGYAFRGEPWKTLNFFTASSADSALLDYFSLTETPVRAGVVNLNRAPTEVLQAILQNVELDSEGGVAPLSPTEAATVASALRRALGPISEPEQIVQSAADIPALINDLEISEFPPTLKWRRESIARAFADVSNTRTWNLMIDVIAQTGRFAQSAADASEFVVRGEKRIWCHLAIDRLTGQLVDIQIEYPVE